MIFYHAVIRYTQAICTQLQKQWLTLIKMESIRIQML